MSVDLWLVRHGETLWNKERRFVGVTDLPLTSRGRAQAGVLKEQLAGCEFEGVWCSRMRRARDTAALCGFEAVVDDRLGELDFGRLEGARWEDVPEETRNRLIGFEDFVAPDGESVADLRHRVVEFLDERGQGRHLIFTHGGVIRLVERELGAEPRFHAPGSLIRLGWPPLS